MIQGLNHLTSKFRETTVILAVGAIIALISIPSSPAPAAETALDRYIAKPDPGYRWELVNTIEGEDHTGYILRMTSQTWRTAEESSQPEWWHWVSIVRPHVIRHDKALLYIGGGNNRDDDPPTRLPERSVGIAVGTGSVVADLGMVPNQPLSFPDAPDKGRYEDDLIAWTRIKYIATGDEEWLVRLAMVKSAVRAMDAVTEFMAGKDGGGHAVNHYVVAGGSKRGWTTWLVGIVDPRVVAMIPIVIDALNTQAITRHHYECYGFFSPALGDYVRHGLYPDWLGTPEIERILEIEDPYMYRDRDRMRIPKLVLNASGDQFFLPDNSQFYFAGLPQEKYLRYVPNAKHNLAGSDGADSIYSFYESVLNDTPRPKFSWEMKDDESIVLTVTDKPKEVNLWQATNPDARDFRLDTIGSAWTSSPLQASENNTYVAAIPEPEKGFSAFFVEVVYESGGRIPFKFTTDVSVLPDLRPYDWDEAKERKARGEDLLKR